MERITKERKTTYNVYVACDGTEFDTEKACSDYENSAQGVLFARYKSCVINTFSEYELFNVGSDENYIDVVKMETDSDINTILQLQILFNGHVKDKNTIWYNKLKSYFDKGSIFFILRGYENDAFWVSNNLEESIQNIVNKVDNTLKVNIEENFDNE